MYLSFSVPRLNLLIQKNSAVVRCNLVANVNQKRRYSNKEDKPAGPAKEEEISVKMPGFVHPENMKEEGYFTQIAKKQLEELKRKSDFPVDRPDKKH